MRPYNLRELTLLRGKKPELGEKQEFPAFGGTKQILSESLAKTEIRYFLNIVKQPHVFTTLLTSKMI